MTGNGTSNGASPTDLQGPLARMWRDVYAKAAGVAEDRTVELLKRHVYQYPHGAGDGGGGGGGGLVELGRAVATAGQQDLRVPATGSLPTGYSGLVLEASGRNNHATTNQNGDVYVFFNDELAGGTSTNPGGYQFSAITHTVGGTTVQVAGSPGTDSWNVGLAPAYNAADPQTSWGLSGMVPLHEGTGLPKTGQFVSGGRRSQSGETPVVRTTTGLFTPAGSPNGPVTSVTLRCGLLWRAGATFVVYGHGPATSGGGGADVTITTDASLTATESPANTFALAARISPDGGNALSLHANGLYATDTTGGGGGTGNTTMYTQTTTPTGATNSLWFNPSETA